MKEVLDDFLVTPKTTINKKDKIAFVLSVIMFIGSALQVKYVNTLGGQVSLSVIAIATLMMVLFCIALNLITVLIGRLFRSKTKRVPIKSKAFWLDRVIGGFINWVIFMLLIFAGYYL